MVRDSLLPEERKQQDLLTAADTGTLFPETPEAETMVHGKASPRLTATPLGPGHVLGSRYQLRLQLGSGGMGEVWLALDLKLQVEVALKFLHPALYAEPHTRELLRNEVRTAREVLSPNVCRIFDLIEIEDRELLSMEYIDGQTLDDLLRVRGALELEEASELATQFLAGLEAIHQAGLVHRDFKPANVMITRTGRVVVMDFGLARSTERESTGPVSGTPAYMSPEHLQGQLVDSRSDLYSAAITLAEMVGDYQGAGFTRKKFLASLRQDPPQLPHNPWRPVLLQALSRDPARRPETARSLARALEEVTLRAGRDEGTSPYPGLASFTETEARFFFGREAEVEALWKKLHRHELIGLIGPSGAGKSSFLRAGLLPAMPAGWRAVVCHPGEAPFVALAQALIPELEGDTEALRQLLRFEDPGVAVSLLGRWQGRHGQALLVVDQFEELFTLNAPPVQSRYAELLGRAAADAGVHVLVALRDDFLFHCHAHRALAPIFSDLTPIGPPAGAALRRALVQPALRCGYRFEDEALVEEMLAEVQQERGALPLLAFAAARLWEARDREAGLLRREAYARIQGVAGALAQHAEATLQRIGLQQEPLVREIFRNLVSAQGTRAACDVEDLLSVFGEQKQPAKDVLKALIDARLLVSFEVERAASVPPSQGQPAGGPDQRSGAMEPEPGARKAPSRALASQRVEIIHESLLRAWPRLVRWQAQDADGAVLRDQLRQAAQVWEARGRPAELLWSGASFRELQLWRERYRGGLSATEESFARAMAEQAARHVRRFRLAAGGVIASLALLLAAMLYLYEGTRQALNKAEANRLLALGRLALEDNPSAAVAYTIASLERADDPVARRFALEALWRGPTALAIRTGATAAWGVCFSPDGRWMAAGMRPDPDLWLWPSDGGAARQLRGHEERVRLAEFLPGSRLLASVGRDQTARLWSVPDGALLRTIRLCGPAMFVPHPDGKRLLTVCQEQDLQLQSWPLPEGEPEAVARLPMEAAMIGLVADPAGQRLIVGAGQQLGWVALQGQDLGQWHEIGRHDKDVWSVSLHPAGRQVAAGDLKGEIRLWLASAASGQPERTLLGHKGGIISLQFSPGGSALASASLDGTARLWNLGEDLSAARPEPVVLRLGKLAQLNRLAFHPSGQWLATATPGDSVVQLWPLARAYAQVLRGHEDATTGLAFDPDGHWLASAAEDGTIRLWPLLAGDSTEPSVLLRTTDDLFYNLAFSARRQALLAGSEFGRVQLVPIRGGEPRMLPGFSSGTEAVAFSPDGRFAAASGGLAEARDAVIRIWDLDSGAIRILDSGARKVHYDIAFSPDGARLASAGADGLRLWDLQDGSSRILQEGPFRSASFSQDGRHLLGASEEGLWLYSLQDGAGRRLPAHDGRLVKAVFTPDGDLAVSGDEEGVVRAGPLDGRTAHLLLGHSEAIRSIAVSPDGRWIASASDDNTVRLWPMPTGQPFHELPYREFLERLQALTNLRAVPDTQAASGYRINLAPFPGWDRLPAW